MYLDEVDKGLDVIFTFTEMTAIIPTIICTIVLLGIKYQLEHGEQFH